MPTHLNNINTKKKKSLNLSTCVRFAEVHITCVWFGMGYEPFVYSQNTNSCARGYARAIK